MLAERCLHDLGLRGASFSAAQAHERAHSLLAGVARRLCAMRGHDLLLHFEPRRLSLRCVDCGWESSGWMFDEPRFSYTEDLPVQHSPRTTLSAARWRRPLDATRPVLRSNRRPLVKSSVDRSACKNLASSSRIRPESMSFIGHDVQDIG